MQAKAKLHGPNGSAIVRTNRSAADGATWTPDNTAGGEDGELATLDGHPWEDVRLAAVFLGAPGGTESVSVTPLMAIPDSSVGSVAGRRWLPLASIVLTPQLDHELVIVDGHDMAFRITAYTAGGSTGVNLMITGGAHRRADKTV